jgi:hypothetical protein
MTRDSMPSNAADPRGPHRDANVWHLRMKFCFLGALALAWMIVTPPSSTMKFRIEQCCFQTRAGCEAALKKMKTAGATCEVERPMGHPKDSRTISSAQPLQLD